MWIAHWPSSSGSHSKPSRSDRGDEFAYTVLAAAHMFTAEPHKAVAACERAIELNPSQSLAYTYLGGTLALIGRAEEGIPLLEKAIRLSPRDPMLGTTLLSMAVARFAQEQYESAPEWAARALQENPNLYFAHALIAASLARLERPVEARAALARADAQLPAGLSETFVRFSLRWAEPNFVTRLIDSLRKAGLRE